MSDTTKAPEGVTEDQWDELRPAAEAIVDGWYPEGRIDWDAFLDRLEDQTDIDLGQDMLSPLITAIKKHVTTYRKLSR